MEPGTLVAARYRIEPFAAHGGMGTVHRALDLETNSMVAIKTTDDDPRFVERFARERRLLEEISHPAIVRYIGSGTHEGRPFLVMEWVDGCDLAEELARGPLTVDEALTLCERVASALSAAHERGVVHRDVKPKNLMLMLGSAKDPRLTDFGIARLEQATRSLTQVGTAVGTPGYMAPEQVQSAGEVDARADLFSLGCVLYACVTAQNPYAAETAFASMARVVAEEPPRLRDLWPEAPRSLDELCARLMAKSPDERPRDGREASDLLAECRCSFADSGLRYQPKSRIGNGEQRLASAVFVELPSGANTTAPSAMTSPETVVGPSYTLDDAVHSWLRGFGREALVIGPTTLAVLFDGAGTPSDLAAKAIACALGLTSRVRAANILVVSAPRDVSRGDLGELAATAQNLLRDLPEAWSNDVVLVDDTTARLSAGVFSFADQVGGAFRISPSATSETVLPAELSPILGRDREREVLELSLREAFEEEAARAILVEGPPGCGKTRLIDDVLSRMARPFPNLHIIRYKPRSLNLAGSIPLFGTCANASGSQASKEEFHAHVRAQLRSGPVVVFVDDLRFANRASLDALEELARDARESALVIIGALRSEDRRVLPLLWHAVDVLDVPLGSLGRPAVDEAIRAELGASPDADVVRRIHDGAGGNAFRLTEMLRAAKRGGPSFPESVLSLTAARLQELGELERTLIRAASVFGEVFWARGVASMIDVRSASEAEQRLRALAQRGFFNVHATTRLEGELELSFRQLALREAAYASLLGADRALAHSLAAEWLSERDASDTASIEAHRAHARRARDKEGQGL